MASKSSDTGERFFGIVGGGAIIFGVIVVLFDLMFDPMRSAIMSLLYILIGSICLMVAAAKFLNNTDKKINEANEREKAANREATPVKKTDMDRTEALIS